MNIMVAGMDKLCNSFLYIIENFDGTLFRNIGLS